MPVAMPNVFTLHIQELRQESNFYTIQVRWFSKIKDVKDILHSITNIAPSKQQLFQSNSSVPLSSSLTMHDLKISKSGQTLRLSVVDGNAVGTADFILNSSEENLLDSECSKILTDVRFGLQRHNVPIKTDVLDCTGGVYFMRAVSGRKVAVFKPQDEEQGAHTDTHKHTHIHTHAHTHTATHTHTNIHTLTHTHTYRDMDTHTHTPHAHTDIIILSHFRHTKQH